VGRVVVIGGDGLEAIRSLKEARPSFPVVHRDPTGRASPRRGHGTPQYVESETPGRRPIGGGARPAVRPFVQD
jgi:hypothetical protein